MRLEVESCSICRDPTPVYVSGGVLVYHRTLSCSALAAGKNKVLDRGGVLASVSVMTRSNAEAGGKGPCHACWLWRWKDRTSLMPRLLDID